LTLIEKEELGLTSSEKDKFDHTQKKQNSSEIG
jgi:hypothetical protein